MLAVRLERAPRAAGQPRHLRRTAVVRGGDRRARDARLPDAAVHLVPEPVSRVAAARTAARRRRARSGRDVEFVALRLEPRAALRARAPASGRCPTQCSQRAVASRERVLDDASTRRRTLPRATSLNDRGGIYALGYPVITWFGHLVNLAELVVLAGVLYRAAARRRRAVQRASAAHPPASGRALLREVPLELLPQAVPRVRRRRGRAGRHPRVRRRAPTSPRRRAPASKTRPPDRDGRAAARRRLRHAAAARHRRRSTSIDDQIMVLVSRAIDQDVNLFDRRSLRGDERSAICSRRGCCRRARPARSTARIVLDRLPTFVGVEAGRRLAVPGGRGAGPRRRTRGNRHRAR